MADRVWLITGCSAGFGEAIAVAALAAGDRVVATARKPEVLAGLAERWGERVVTARLDVTSPADIDSAVAAALGAFGRVDVLVNNAGSGLIGAVEEIDLPGLRDQFETLFFGAAALTKAVLPHMRERGSGTIIQISSLAGRGALPGLGAYSAAKFALEGFSEALAVEVAPHGVRVMIAEPGGLRTEFGGSRLRLAEPMDAYADTAGATRAGMAAAHGAQDGDPAKAAAAILTALDAETPPLRLALGEDAVTWIRKRHEGGLAELQTWETVSSGIGY